MHVVSFAADDARSALPRSDFPRPVADLVQGRIWLLDDVDAWITARRPQLADLEEQK
jgi:hypothetical protein